jgi:hypothetical protein
VRVNGRDIRASAVVSNANSARDALSPGGPRALRPPVLEAAEAVRLNNSSTQVYMALDPDDSIDESTGDLLFSSTAPYFRTEALLSRDITSRTFSFYYPKTRPDRTAALPDRLEYQRPL